MTEYRAIYKCRLCGEEFENVTPTSRYIYYQNMVNSISTYQCGTNASMPSIEKYMHDCKDGSHGYIELIGFRKVEDKNESD
mgnify:FL=1